VETTEELERAQNSILRDVLGVVFVACQPARQIVRGIQVRHNRLFETRLLILFFQSFVPSVRVTSSIQDRCAPELFPSSSLFIQEYSTSLAGMYEWKRGTCRARKQSNKP